MRRLETIQTNNIPFMSLERKLQESHRLYVTMEACWQRRRYNSGRWKVNDTGKPRTVSKHRIQYLSHSFLTFTSCRMEPARPRLSAGATQSLASPQPFVTAALVVARVYRVLISCIHKQRWAHQDAEACGTPQQGWAVRLCVCVCYLVHVGV